MNYCPEHIESLVEDANHLFPDDHDNFHHYYLIKCRCGEFRFSLVEGSKKSLVATCERCNREWRIYDLAYYPSASKLKGEEHFGKILVPKEQSSKLFIGYEYGETDDGDAFDRNDITWCIVFVEKEGKLQRIFDDETA